MRKLQVLAKALGIVSLALFPAVLALFQLGMQLGAVERMHGRAAGGARGDVEMVGTYVTDGDEGLRFRPAGVRRR